MAADGQAARRETLRGKAEVLLRRIPVDRALLGVAARFAAYLVISHSVIVGLAIRTDLMGDLAVWTAGTAGALMRATGVSATHDVATILIPNRVLVITTDCTGVFIAALLISLLLAYPVAWRHRVVGSLTALAVVGVANLARLVAIAHVSVRTPAAFEVVHDYLFQVGMVMVGVVFWAAWLGYARRRA